MPDYGDPVAWLICQEYNFQPLEGTLREKWELDEGREMHRFANTKDGTNILFIYKEEFPKLCRPRSSVGIHVLFEP
ncbi:hypothetical protein ES703_13506 [subsurface metagenome]